MQKIFSKEDTLENSPKIITNTKKAILLENVIHCYCIYNQLTYNMDFVDLTPIRNFKNHKGEHEIDFLIKNLAVIEAKNWDCFGGKGYRVAKKEVDNQVLDRFTKYPMNLKRILIIAHPNWYESARKYLLRNGVYIIELGFVVTNDKQVTEKAYNIIKAKMDKILCLN